MTLPVSSYEELLTRVRSLTQETRQLQRQLDSPLLDQNDNEHSMNTWENSGTGWNFAPRAAPPSLAVSTPDPLIPPQIGVDSADPKVVGTQCNGVLARLLGWPSKEEVTGPETKEQDERRTTPETSVTGGEGIGVGQKWGSSGSGGSGGGGTTEYNVWHSVSGPIHNTTSSTAPHQTPIKQDVDQTGGTGGRSYSQQQLGAKVEMVYSLLSMLGTHDREKMTTTLLAMSSSPDSCQAMRQSGCVPLLVQLVHAREESAIVRQRASQALHNLVHCHADDKRGRREARVLRLLQQLIDFADSVPNNAEHTTELEDGHPGAAIAALMKLSFDEEHRHAMCQLGALHAIATLIQVDADAHGSQTNSQSCVTVRRYAGMALTNLTFGDSNNKALLCSFQPFMSSLVAQLSSPSEDLRQVTASVLRNLSWRADAASKATLREVGAVSALMHAAMEAKKESTLKSILSALWNLSAHCNMNKVEICAVEGSLQYLVEMLSFQAPSRTLAIVENAGGILRNISSHIALREDYRNLLREQNCLPLLLQQLKSPSLTVVSNACGTLWNLSARCSQDQRALWDLGAVPMLRSLVHSKHRMISMGASAALKNLLASRPDADILDRAARGMPTLLVRKRRALEQELDSTLAETCENIESPERWDSHESVTSTHSENIFDRSSRAAQHCHRSGSLQMMKRSGSNAGPNNLSTSTEILREQQHQQQLHQVDSQMQRLKLNETASENGCDTATAATTTTVDTHSVSDELSNKCEEKAAMVSSDESGGVPRPTDERPIDYSLKYKDRSHRSGKEESEDNNRLSSPHHRDNDDNAANNKKQATACLESELLAVEELDTPTDYSLKYQEEGERENKAKEDAGGGCGRVAPGSGGSGKQRFYDTEADYNLMVMYRNCKPPDMSPAEVELEDQPTDYSLKYRENSGCEDVDLEEDGGRGKEHHHHLRHDGDDEDGDDGTGGGGGHYAETDLDEALDYYQEDKVQTYCTEGTPYTFSTATSMSDLRATDPDLIDQQPEPSPKLIKEDEEVEGQRGGGGGVGNEVVEQEEGGVLLTMTVAADVAASPASAEGTLSGGMIQPSTPKEEIREGKVVTFETPLMFSRCSSISSLSSCEPPDDRSSVVSEFSRLTSGMVSPSELPDSPTQTVPPSPRNIKPPTGIKGSSHPAIGGSVFEDTVSSFKEESTPLHFSTGTSLSSLTFDDEPTHLQQQMIKHQTQRTNNTSDSNTVSSSAGGGTSDVSSPFPLSSSSNLETTSASGKTDASGGGGGGGKEGESPVVLAPVSEEEDEDDMLAACINIGMQNSSSRQRNTNIRPAPLLSRLPKPQRHSGIPIKSAAGTIGGHHHHHGHGPPSQRRHHHHNHHHQQQQQQHPSVIIDDCEVNEDSTTEFCTEGTPANISHATSHSDLSLICALSDDGSSDQDNILAECIQSAMPQARHLKSSVKTETPAVGSKQQQQQTPVKEDCNSTGRSSVVTRGERDQAHTPAHATALPRIRDLKGIAAQDETECFAVEGSPGVFSTRSSLSDLTINSTNKCRDRCQVVSPAPPDDGSSPLSSLEPEVTVLSRQPSTGSLSGGDWTEEQALLEQCITSGMPKTKNGRTSSVGPTPPPAATDSDVAAATTTDRPPPLTMGVNGNQRPPEGGEEEEGERGSSRLDTSPATATLTDLHPRLFAGPLAAAPGNRNCPDVMKESADTWNDDTSPNDISFPSISLTAPMISSYKSIPGDDDRSDPIIAADNAGIGRCLDDLSLTDSNIIRLEEGRVAIIANMDMESSYMSDLDSVRPPSAMGSLLSLTQSISEAEKRKDRMRGLVARRAITGDSSLSWNNIDSIKPPSGMDELIDLENSILSVASIMSEVADSPQSCSEDITLAETSDTTLDNPVSPTTQRRVTPKQKRQNVKDRYNTYTINTDQIQNGYSEVTEVSSTIIEDKFPDSVFEEDDTLKPDDDDYDDDDVVEDDVGVCDEAGSDSRPQPKTKRVQRLTPKQKRLADKDRFRTRTLGLEEQSAFNVNSNSDNNKATTETVIGTAAEQLPEITSTTPTRQLSRSLDSDDALSSDEEVELERGKPRVVKPTEKPQQAEVKAIRGRKKVRSGIPIVAKSSPVVSSSTTHHQSSHASSEKKTTTNASLNNSSSLQTPPPPPPPLQRQGTFTKDEPATPPSGIPVLSKKVLSSPVKTANKKKKNNSVTTAQGGTPGCTTGPAVRKLVGRGRAGSLPRTETTKKAAAGVRSSVSNQSLKSEALGSNSSLSSTGAAATGGGGAQTQTVASTGGTPRPWNSNSSLNTAKKDATSKIASLWKKVEDSKRKENSSGTTKDSRVWIAAPPATAPSPHSKQAA